MVGTNELSGGMARQQNAQKRSYSDLHSNMKKGYLSEGDQYFLTLMPRQRILLIISKAVFTKCV